MAHYPSLCTGNLHILTSTYNEIVTITSQPNLVSSTLSPIGPKQCAASLSSPNKKRNTSGRLSPNANIPNGLWTRWRKDSTGLPVRLLMGLITKAPQLPNVATNEIKTKGHIVISYKQGLCESIKKICGRYCIQTYFKGGSTIKNPLVSPKDKDPMVN